MQQLPPTGLSYMFITVSAISSKMLSLCYLLLAVLQFLQLSFTCFLLAFRVFCLFAPFFSRLIIFLFWHLVTLASSLNLSSIPRFLISPSPLFHCFFSFILFILHIPCFISLSFLPFIVYSSVYWRGEQNTGHILVLRTETPRNVQGPVTCICAIWCSHAERYTSPYTCSCKRGARPCGPFTR